MPAPAPLAGPTRKNPLNHGDGARYHTEGLIVARHILANPSGARVAVLFQNDDVGKDDLKGLLDGLGDKAKTMVVAQQRDEMIDATVHRQLVTRKARGAETFCNITTPKFAARAARAARATRQWAEIGWKPMHDLASVSGAVASKLEQADPEQAGTPEVAAFTAWMTNTNRARTPPTCSVSAPR